MALREEEKRRREGEKRRREEERRESAAKERAAREGSNFDVLKAGDFAGVADTPEDPRDKHEWSRTKRQEYSRKMGEFATFLRTGNPALAKSSADYIARLGEEERRFGNRRIARTVSLVASHEELHTRRFLSAVSEHLAGHRIEPVGYARKTLSDRPAKRKVIPLLSDLHFGSNLSPKDNPTPFGPVEESRRFDKVVHEIADYKPQYRNDTDLLLLLNGDLIEGFLGHDNTRDESPLVEQEIILLKYMEAAIGHLAAAYPRVTVHCQPGNHGRDKLLHPGRATSSKWKGIEWKLYKVLEMLCRSLPNVTFDVPYMAVSIIDVFGSKILVSHGDTEVPIKHPDSGASWNAAQLAQINSSRRYGCEFIAAMFGHYHAGRLIPGTIWRIHNAALVPPAGYARGMSGNDEKCGQWLIEGVKDHPIGDTRFLDVGPSEDHDQSLGKIIKPFRLSEAP
jgi:hypothetical protein